MMLLCGTVPNRELPLTFGQVKQEGDALAVEGRQFSRTQGTGAMLSSALSVTTYLGLPSPYILIAGDLGDGKGTREMFRYLIEHLVELSPRVLTLHYCLPIMGLMRKLCEVVSDCSPRPILIADAGAMYAVKGAGLAQEFDIFTPDSSEIAFLADPEATHPAYISHHLFAADAQAIPDQIVRAFKLQSAAKLLLVKGKIDYIARDGQICCTITEPDIPTLEAIGGTGDTITGLVSALVYAGLDPNVAAEVACCTNRMAGQLLQPTPATKVKQVVEQFPTVLRRYYDQWTTRLSAKTVAPDRQLLPRGEGDR